MVRSNNEEGRESRKWGIEVQRQHIDHFFPNPLDISKASKQRLELGMIKRRVRLQECLVLTPQTA